MMKVKVKTLYFTCVSFYKCSSRFPESGLYINHHENLALQELNRVASHTTKTTQANYSSQTNHSVLFHAALLGARGAIHHLSGIHPLVAPPNQTVMIAWIVIRAVSAIRTSAIYQTLCDWLSMPTREHCGNDSPVTHLELLFSSD